MVYNFLRGERSKWRVNSWRVKYPLEGIFLGIVRYVEATADTATPGIALPETSYWFSTAKPRPTVPLFSFDTWYLCTTYLYLSRSIKFCPRLDLSQLRLWLNLFKSSMRLDRANNYMNVNILLLQPLESVVLLDKEHEKDIRGFSIVYNFNSFI